MDYTPLKAEIQTDPLGLGYAAPLSTGDFNAIATLLNATTGKGAGTITMPTMDNASFVTAFLPYLPTVFTLDAAKQAFYTLVWHSILAMPTINLAASNVSGLMTQAVTDRLLTAAQATALNQRTGSRAEVLCGVGASPSWEDISKLMGA